MLLDLLAAQSITAVTFAPDEALGSRHDARLELAAGGRWNWQPIREESRTA